MKMGRFAAAAVLAVATLAHTPPASAPPLPPCAHVVQAGNVNPCAQLDTSQVTRGETVAPADEDDEEEDPL